MPKWIPGDTAAGKTGSAPPDEFPMVYDEALGSFPARSVQSAIATVDWSMQLDCEGTGAADGAAANGSIEIWDGSGWNVLYSDGISVNGIDSDTRDDTGTATYELGAVDLADIKVRVGGSCTASAGTGSPFSSFDVGITDWSVRTRRRGGGGAALLP